jgi:hypothetical protein
LDGGGGEAEVEPHPRAGQDGAVPAFAVCTGIEVEAGWPIV